ncbi:hypothetical protein [Candidatus Nitrosocosmicus hydrocola]|uniref:hypothetical protein n=1 Tax=Candidatus Nitrosocosmicus hydrocola TaxID=1826872 RepID=UPI0011E605D7|nr:hypothetical protein [Candidatus Nitrosocosmicus hydrocola]
MVDNPISMQDFILNNKGITYFCFESLTHRLIIRFDTAEPMLELNSIDIDDNHKQNFLRAGDALKFLMIEHDEDNNTVIILEPKDMKEIIHFRYLSYFKYDPNYTS